MATKVIKGSNRSRGVGNALTKLQVRAMIDGRLNSLVERKIHTVNTGATAATTAGVIVPITQSLVQGDNINTREGDKIVVKRLQVNASFALNTLQPVSTIRYILFLDTMANGVVPTPIELVSPVSVTGLYEPVNLLKRRFHILADIVRPLVLQASNQTVHYGVMFKKEIQIYFGDPGNIAAANQKNALYVLMISDASANQPTFAFSHQLEFFDL